MLYDFVLSAVASALIGVALWAVLPRGAALTRAPGHPDMWTIQNDSPIPVRLTSVTYQSMDTIEDGKVVWREVPVEAAEEVAVEPWGNAGLRLTPNEEQLYYELTLTRLRWQGFVIPPGDTLSATVMNNRVLRLKYRRAGWTGIFERREIRIHGGT